MKRKYRNQKGFSLVEILVAIAILSVMIIPVVNIFISSSMSQVRSEEEVIAMNIALQKMEEYRYLGFETLKQRLDTIRESGQELYSSSTPVDNYPLFQRSIRIGYYPNSNPSNLEEERRISLEVIVSWKPRNLNKSLSQKLFTVVTDRKPFL